MEKRNLAQELNGFVVRAQRALAEYLPPDSDKSESGLISELLGVLDSPQIRRLQKEIADKTDKRVFFTSDA